MKNIAVLILLSIITFFNISLNAQDVTFTQWEQLPQHFNPALTGNFEGTLKIRAKHRNTWQSVLGANSFRTSAAAVEYKFKTNKNRQFSLGFHTLFSKAGASSFKTKTYNLSTSLVQNMNANHSIALGFNVGLGNNSFNPDNLRWGTPNPNPITLPSSVNFGDVSVGLNWRYVTDNHFGFHLGSSLLHVNKPNISFNPDHDSRLALRFNLHGNIELPVAERFSLAPSFLYIKQDFQQQLLFGLYNKWYLDPNYARAFQLGIFAKASSAYSETMINAYVLSASLELKSLLFGLTFERFSGINSNAFEFSVGYTLGAASR